MSNEPTIEFFLKSAPGLLGDLARYINATQETNQPGIALAVSLAFLGTLKSERIITRSKLAPNIYTLALATSGAGKTHAQQIIGDICMRAGLQRLLMGRPASDSGVRTRLQSHNRQFLMWDEFGQGLAEISHSTNSYRVAIIGLILELFSEAGRLYIGKEYAEKERQDINRPFLSLSGISTPGEFYSALTQQFIEKGFLSRFLVFEGHSAKVRKDCSYEPIPDSIIEQVLAIQQGTPSAGSGNLAALKPVEHILTFEDSEIEQRGVDMSWEAREESRSDTELTFAVRSKELWLKVCMACADSRGVCSKKSAYWSWGLVSLLIKRLAATCESTVHETNQDLAKARRGDKFKTIIKPGEKVSSMLLSRRCNDRGFFGQERKALIDSMLESGYWVAQRVANQDTGRENTVYQLSESN